MKGWHGRLTQLEAPTQSPVDLSELKERLRVIGNHYDAEMQHCIDYATAYLDGCKGVLGRALMKQKWLQTFDRLTGSDDFTLALSPFISLVSVKYYNRDGALTTYPIGNISVQGINERIFKLKAGLLWPYMAERVDALQVEFYAGYEKSSEIPADLRLAILGTAAHYFETRDGEQRSAFEPHNFIKEIIQKYRVYHAL